MRLLTKLSTLSTSVVLGAGILMSGGLAHALGAGQIEGGSSNYTISNVSKGTGFSNTQSADACNVVEYRVHLYNPGPDPISDVKVEATINTMTPYTQYVSTATVFAPDSLTPQVNFQATLNLSSAQTESYVKNSTVLLDSAGNVIKSSANGTLDDTITMGAGGIDIGSLGESVQEYLEFKAQVNCPPVTPVATPPVTPVATPVATPAVTPPAVLVNTGPGSIVGAFLGFSIAGTAVYMTLLRRKLSRS